MCVYKKKLSELQTKITEENSIGGKIFSFLFRVFSSTEYSLLSFTPEKTFGF